MNNRMYLVIIMLIYSMMNYAQVAEYYFTQQNSTYTEITGGTVLWSGTFDNDISEEITIPSFTYNGTVFTSLFISANGFITFGTAPTATNYTPISSSAAYSGAISGFGRDLNQAATGSPAVRYELISSEFVIQWKDVRRKDIASETISFQIRLNTSNNYIAVIYGGTISPGAYATYPQVGLRGPDNTLATSVHNRTIAAAGGNWINSVRGTGITNTMYFNSVTPATVPTAGLTYTWKPLYNPINFTATAISLSQIDLSWQKNSLNHNVMLAYSTTATFGTPVSGTVYSEGNTITGGGTVLFYGDGTSYSHTGRNANTVYYYKIWSYDAVPDYSTGAAANTRTAYTLPYLQEFNGSLPPEWSTEMAVTAIHGTAGTKGLTERRSSAGTAYAIAPLAGSITASTYLSFHYRMVEYAEYPLLARQPGPGDKIEVQVSLDDGATFTTFHTIDENNHIPATEFANKVLSLAAYEGDFIKIRFLCTWGAGDYYVDIDNVLFEDGTNMSYSGSTTEQFNFTNVAINSTDNDIVRLQVVTQKSSNALSVDSITFNTTGSTSALNDIASAKVYYTTIPVFSTGIQYGTAVSNPNGTFKIKGTRALSQGNNYFWLAYDIKATATAGNVVDAQCTQLFTSESGTAKIPTVTTVTGSRKVGAIISGTKAIPADYATIALAVTALNNGVVGSGGVTFNVDAGHTESSANIILTATGTSSDQIIFQKTGEGANPLITASAGTSTTVDGIIKIAGGDYVTFDGIDVLDPASNTTSTTRMEWGYALVKMKSTAPVNGCQYVTIKNSNITMQKIYASSVGIYAGNHIATSTAGVPVIMTTDAMNNCKIYSNNITNVYTGIKLSGYDDAPPYSFYNQGNEVGVSGGNTITNFGGSSAAVNGIYTIYEAGIRIANNEITGGSGSANVLTGINISTATSANVDIYENSVTLTGDATTYAVTGISNTAGSTAAGNTVNIYNNSVENCTYSTATTGTFTAVVNSAAASTVNIYGNVVSNNTLAGTGAFTGIDGGSPASLNIYENTISGNQKNGASGYMYLTKAGNAMVDFHGNDIFNNSFPASSGTTLCVIYGYYNIDNASNEILYGNNIYNLTVTGSNTSTSSKIYGIHTNTVASATKSIYQNNIYGFHALTGLVYGIYQDLGSTVSIYKNDVHDLESSSIGTNIGTATGILVNSGENVYVYDNFISDLRTPVCPGADAIHGISVLSTQTNSMIGVYYNTIYLDATSGAANFGTSGLYHTCSSTSTTAALDLRNNIIINNSTQKGTYYTAALRSNHSYLNNYLSSSNNNIYYAGNPGTYNLIFYGSVSRQTIESYREFVGPNRDSISFSEFPPFADTSSAPYDLHLTDGNRTYCESGAQPVTVPIAITEDFDGATRPSAPDIGADEFSGIPAFVEPPALLSASVLNSQQIEIEFGLNPDDDDVILIWNTTGTFTGPTGTPVTGQPLAGGTVLYAGMVSPVTHSSLTPGTAVYYKAFSYNGFNYSMGLTANGTPNVTPVTGFSAVCGGQEQIDLGWTKNIYGHDVMISSRMTAFSGNPVQGTEYNVGDSVPSAGRVVYKGPLSAFTHDELDSWSQHYYKIWSLDIFNYFSTGAYANAITDADTIETLPYLMDFGAAWTHSPAAPGLWKVVDVGGSGTLTWQRITSFYYQAPACAEGSGNQNDYLISPPVTMPDVNCRIVWWDRVEDPVNNNKYRVLLSTAGSEPVSFTTILDTFNCLNTAWTRHEIDLSAYQNQTVFIAFHQFYSATQYSNFAIDEVYIETYTLGPSEQVFPTEGLLTFTEFNLKWTEAIYSELATGFKVYLGTDPSPVTLVYDGAELSFPVSSLSFNTTYYWKVVPYNANGDALTVPVWSFTTENGTQLAESFEADYFPPVSWDQDFGWSYSVSSVFHGDHSAVRGTTLSQVKLITPLLDIEAGDKLEFFAGTSSSASLRIQILYSPDNATWTSLGDPIPVSVASWAFHSVDLGELAGNNYFLAFGVYYIGGGSSGNVYLDHVTGPEVVPVIPATATNPEPADMDTFINTVTLLAWDPVIWGGIPSGYKVYFDTSPDPATLIYTGPDEFFQSATLLLNTTYYWKVVPYNIAGDAPDCPVWSFTTAPDGGVQIGRGSVSYIDLPIYPYYAYSYTQSLYLQPEIDIPDRRIESIFYYWSGGEQGYNFKDWAIFMGHTTKTAFSSSADWVPVGQMIMVFDNEVSIPDTAGWVEILLETPFVYNNTDNLVIAVDENTDGFSSGIGYFYGTEDMAARGIKYYSDETNPDPATPPTAYDLVNGVANIRLQLEDLPTGPSFRIYPDYKDFEIVLLEGESNPQVFTIKNNGIGTLTIISVAKSGADADQFILADANTYPVYLTANQAITVNVSFNPTAEGAKTAMLEITHDLSGTPHEVILSGFGVNPLVSDFPFNETFEDDSQTRIKWSQIQESGNGKWTYDEGAGDGNIYNAHAGTLNARFTSTQNEYITKLVSPVFNLAGVTNPQLFFWYGQEFWSPDQNALKVYYRTASNQPWVELFYDYSDRYAWTPKIIALPDQSATYQLAFEGIDNYGYPNVIDDVIVGSASGTITIWYGTISGDWTNPANWSHGVPGLNYEVIITSGDYVPVIDDDYTIFKINIETDASIYITVDGSLTVTGN